MAAITPATVLASVAAAVPRECHENIIIVGSLAAGYLLLKDETRFQVRTKDVDCVLSPHVRAVESGKTVVAQLLAGGWRPREEGEHGKPGNAGTPDQNLPAVRLFPPDSRDWFIELLTVPASETDSFRPWTRLQLPDGDYGLPSFRFLALATFKPVKTGSGLYCARPEMMALAGLLEHTRVKPDPIRGSTLGNRAIKRSNKDLGRVLAIAWLSREEELEIWPKRWEEGLRSCLPKTWHTHAAGAGSGLRKLLSDPEDLAQAHYTCINGLLAGSPVSLEQLRIAGLRLIQDAITPLEARANEV